MCDNVIENIYYLKCKKYDKLGAYTIGCPAKGKLPTRIKETKGYKEWVPSQEGQR